MVDQAVTAELFDELAGLGDIIETVRAPNRMAIFGAVDFASAVDAGLLMVTLLIESPGRHIAAKGWAITDLDRIVGPTPCIAGGRAEVGFVTRVVADSSRAKLVGAAVRCFAPPRATIGPSGREALTPTFHGVADYVMGSWAGVVARVRAAGLSAVLAKGASEGGGGGVATGEAVHFTSDVARRFGAAVALWVVERIAFARAVRDASANAVQGFTMMVVLDASLWGAPVVALELIHELAALDIPSNALCCTGRGLGVGAQIRTVCEAGGYTGGTEYRTMFGVATGLQEIPVVTVELLDLFTALDIPFTTPRAI